jgi:hypothetical protein
MQTTTNEQGDQIGRFFTNLATFGSPLGFFERMKEPKDMEIVFKFNFLVDILALFGYL